MDILEKMTVHANSLFLPDEVRLSFLLRDYYWDRWVKKFVAGSPSTYYLLKSQYYQNSIDNAIRKVARYPVVQAKLP
jgi:hypothetical protein